MSQPFDDAKKLYVRGDSFRYAALNFRVCGSPRALFFPVVKAFDERKVKPLDLSACPISSRYFFCDKTLNFVSIWPFVFAKNRKDLGHRISLMGRE
jgi:hypothetical protein